MASQFQIQFGLASVPSSEERNFGLHSVPSSRQERDLDRLLATPLTETGSPVLRLFQTDDEAEVSTATPGPSSGHEAASPDGTEYYSPLDVLTRELQLFNITDSEDMQDAVCQPSEMPPTVMHTPETGVTTSDRTPGAPLAPYLDDQSPLTAAVANDPFAMATISEPEEFIDFC